MPIGLKMPSRYWARNRRGTAARKPAIGPAAPISAIAFLVGTGSLSETNAPNVPIKYGNGIKNGSDALTLYKLEYNEVI
ncbi:hypothetical protein FACI_IFERC00001G0681 [Ferroplasma acidarmanus Fer1]|uniref:Uncharacterized protein n=1 Tax=Ferroplasma acidarmanus Fer1 TaxID=333146 RepID=S0AP27_FERAC|nr:hypothetical protein FACI_IFERC00001G0681 [Ferroplasma acidarmanus Fer1]